MGKASDSELHAAESSTILVNHFSHPHPLKLFKFLPRQFLNLPSCSACNLQPFESVYACCTCNYYLHQACLQMPENITHISHPHQLKLTLSPPYHNNGFSCDICKKTGFNHWLYRCNSCEFDAHLNCSVTILGDSVRVNVGKQTSAASSVSAADLFINQILGDSPPVNVGKQNSAASSSAELLMNSRNDMNQIVKQATNDVSSIYNMMFPEFTSSGAPSGGVGVSSSNDNSSYDMIFQETNSGDGNHLQASMGGAGANTRPLNGGGEAGSWLEELTGGVGGINLEELMGGTRERLQSCSILGDSPPLNVGTQNSVASSVSAEELFRNSRNDMNQMFKQVTNDISSIYDIMLPGFSSGAAASGGVGSGSWLHTMMGDVGLSPSNTFSSLGINSGDANQAPTGGAGANALPSGGGEAGTPLQGLSGGGGVNLQELMGGTREQLQSCSILGDSPRVNVGTQNLAESSVSATDFLMNYRNDMNQLFKEATDDISSIYDMMLPGFSSSGAASGGVGSGSSLHAMMDGVGLNPSNDFSGDANQFQALTGGASVNTLPLNGGGGGEAGTRLQGLTGGSGGSVNLQELMTGTRELRQSLFGGAAASGADLFQDFLEASRIQ